MVSSRSLMGIGKRKKTKERSEGWRLSKLGPVVPAASSDDDDDGSPIIPDDVAAAPLGGCDDVAAAKGVVARETPENTNEPGERPEEPGAGTPARARAARREPEASREPSPPPKPKPPPPTTSPPAPDRDAEPRRAGRVPPVSSSDQLASLSSVATDVAAALDDDDDDDDDEDDDASLADEASLKVWSAYQRWRVTKIRLHSIPSSPTGDADADAAPTEPPTASLFDLDAALQGVAKLVGVAAGPDDAPAAEAAAPSSSSGQQRPPLHRGTSATSSSSSSSFAAWSTSSRPP